MLLQHSARSRKYLGGGGQGGGGVEATQEKTNFKSLLTRKNGFQWIKQIEVVDWESFFSALKGIF